MENFNWEFFVWVNRFEQQQYQDVNVFDITPSSVLTNLVELLKRSRPKFRIRIVPRTRFSRSKTLVLVFWPHVCDANVPNHFIQVFQSTSPARVSPGPGLISQPCRRLKSGFCWLSLTSNVDEVDKLLETTFQRFSKLACNNRLPFSLLKIRIFQTRDWRI